MHGFDEGLLKQGYDRNVGVVAGEFQRRSHVAPNEGYPLSHRSEQYHAQAFDFGSVKQQVCSVENLRELSRGILTSSQPHLVLESALSNLPMQVFLFGTMPVEGERCQPDIQARPIIEQSVDSLLPVESSQAR